MICWGCAYETGEMQADFSVGRHILGKAEDSGDLGLSFPAELVTQEPPAGTRKLYADRCAVSGPQLTRPTSLNITRMSAMQ